MLQINEVHTTIGVQGWAKINGKMECIESFVERKFGWYSIQGLRLRMYLRNTKVQYIKIYKKTPISVPFLEWYDSKGNRMTEKERNDMWGLKIH